MNLIKNYGRRIAGVLVAAGLICLLSAFFIFTTPYHAILWAAGAPEPVEFPVDNAIAGNWLLSGGIRLFPGDRLYFAGMLVNPSFKLPELDRQVLVYRPAFPVTLTEGGSSQQFFSAAHTLAGALWEHGMGIVAGDWTSLPLDTPLTGPMALEIRRGKAITISVGDGVVSAVSAEKTVGAALADAGIALQFLDYSIPAEDKPVPEDGQIGVIRVSELSQLEEEAIPYPKERVADPELTAGQSKVLQTGQNGARTALVVVRRENGKEVDRDILFEWISMQPISEKTAYGTQLGVQPGVGEYWLSKEVYITSYRDTGSPTASGIWPYYGVIAVSPSWYKILKGSSIYVPGYGVGTVLDVCPGCAGKPWIDVFIPIADYMPWSRNETVFFLPPAPANFSGDLP
jgi:uncharacterized protein YabE (DUF348 family)